MHIGLILIALAFPLLELAVLIKTGQIIGFWRTLLVLALAAVAGGLVIRAQGLAAAQRSWASACAAKSDSPATWRRFSKRW